MNSKTALTVFTLVLTLAGIVNATAKDIPGPHGIYMLGSKDSGDGYLVALDTPGVDFLAGFSHRASWATLHPAPDIFDFSSVIEQIRAVEANGDKLTLELIVFSPPQHVLDAAVETVLVTRSGAVTEIPAPWDTNAQISYTQMLDALANTPVQWTAPDGRVLSVRLTDHPSLQTVTATIVGISSIRDIGSEVSGSPNYTREKFLNAMNVSVRASREAFPSKFGFISFFKMNDTEGTATNGDTSDDLDQEAFTQLMRDYNNPGQLHLGLFQENLSDSGPTTDGIGRFLFEASTQTYILFQALTAWTNPAFTNTPAEKVASGTPITGIDFAQDQYGATYFEIYLPDIQSTNLHESLRVKAGELAALATPDLVAAVLPQARAVSVNDTASVFATLINISGQDLVNCAPALPELLAGVTGFSFQSVDSANQLSGTANTATDILAGQAQGYVIGLTPLSSFEPQQVEFDFTCDDAKPAAASAGVNTLLLSATNVPSADILAIAATPDIPGVAGIDGDGAGAGFFTIAAINIGAADDLTITADTGLAGTPVTLNVCQTDPVTSICLTTPAAQIQTHANASETLTFGVFISGQGFAIPFDPAQTRAHARFTDSTGKRVGSTSVAMQSIATVQ